MTKILPLLSLRILTKIISTALLIAFASTWSILAQQVSISIGNTIAKQGQHLQIEATGTLTFTQIDSIRIIIHYNANRLKIDSVIGGSMFALQCKNPLITDQIMIVDGTLSIECTNVKQTSDGNLFRIYCTVLAGLGSVAEISPKECFINGGSKTGVLTSGKITIDDTPVSVKFLEGIGLPYANPSVYLIQIPYTIDTPTPVYFTIYDLSGRVVEETPIIDRTQGLYVFNYLPRDGVFANGVYFLRMTTVTNSYFTYLLRLR